MKNKTEKILKERNKTMKHVFVAIIVIGAFICGWFGKPTKIETVTETEVKYDCTQMGNFGDICRNFLNDKKAESCITEWESGYRTGYIKGRQ